jgi:hypothetical protein
MKFIVKMQMGRGTRGGRRVVRTVGALLEIFVHRELGGAVIGGVARNFRASRAWRGVYRGRCSKYSCIEGLAGRLSGALLEIFLHRELGGAVIWGVARNIRAIGTPAHAKKRPVPEETKRFSAFMPI